MAGTPTLTGPRVPPAPRSFDGERGRTTWARLRGQPAELRSTMLAGQPASLRSPEPLRGSLRAGEALLAGQPASLREALLAGLSSKPPMVLYSLLLGNLGATIASTILRR